MRTKFRRIPVFLFLGCFLVTMLAISPAASAWYFNDQVKVMTQNLYLGADIFAVLEAAYMPDPDNPEGPPIPNTDPLAIPTAVAQLFETVQYTNFPERAEAIANEIWFHRPHLIGLQEVSKWYVQSPSDFFTGNTAPTEEDIFYDYLQILLNALAKHGLHYEVAAEGYNADVELPMLTGFITIPGYPDPVPTFDDLRMVDRDVILVRCGVDAWNPVTGGYTTNVSESIGGIDLEFTRGWVAVEVELCGEEYRFVNTHLEVRSEEGSGFRAVQSAQMLELLTILSYENKPVIMVGDFNSSPTDVPGVYIDPEEGPIYYVPPYLLATDPSYIQVIDPTYSNDYLDAWDLIFWPRDGYTSGFSETIDNPFDQLTSRIDLVFVLPQDKEIKWVIGTVVGDNIFNMTPSGLWPSDHGGVVTWITFK